MVRTEEQLTTLPYTRDPSSPTVELITNEVEFEPEAKNTVQIVVENFVTKEEKNEKNIAAAAEENDSRKTSISIKDDDSELFEDSEDNEDRINSISKPANEDFNYIKSPIRSKPKKADPIAELKQMSQKNLSDDEPPFNFKGMLRKTNYQKENIKPQVEEENTKMFSLRKTNFQKNTATNNSEEKTIQNNKVGKVINDKQIKDNKKINTNNQINGCYISGELEKGKYVKLEIAPGILIEGFEIDL